MKKNLLLIIVFGLFAFLLSFVHSPARLADVGTDPGVYQYVGNTILRGDVPYADAWDHKQPLTYFLYALASVLTGRTSWAIWLLEFVSLWLTGIFSFLLLRRYLGRMVSAAVVLVLLFSTWSFYGFGNPEQLALPFYAASLLLFQKIMRPGLSTKKTVWVSVGLGALFAGCFFLKQSLIAVPGAIGVFYVLSMLVNRQWKQLLILLGMGLGFVLVTILFGGYFLVNHALPQYLEAAFTFNFMYADTGLLEKLKSVVDQIEIISAIPILFLTFGLWIGGLAVLCWSQMERIAALFNQRWFKWAGLGVGVGLVLLLMIKNLGGERVDLGFLEAAGLLIALILIGLGLWKAIRPQAFEGLIRAAGQPFAVALRQKAKELDGFQPVGVLLFFFVLVFNSLSGEHYGYYNISFYPAALLLFGVSLALLQGWVADHGLGRVFGWCAAGIGLVSLLVPLQSLITQYVTPRDESYRALVTTIREDSKPEDPIYSWGTHTAIYTDTGRVSPSRYFYQVGPINWEPFATQYGVMDELMVSLNANPPKMMVVSDEENFSTQDGECQKFAQRQGYRQPFFDFLCENYQFSQSFGEMELFVLKESN